MPTPLPQSRTDPFVEGGERLPHAAQSLRAYRIFRHCGTIHFHDVRVAPEEILRSAADDAAHLLRERNRTYSHAAAQSPAQDLLLQQVVGEIASATFAAESILLQIPRSGRLASQRHGVTEQWFFLVPKQGMPVGTPGAKARYRP